jgi:hypothetical protein
MRNFNFTVVCLFAIAAVNKVRTLRLESYVAMSPLPTTTELCGYLRGDDDTPPVEALPNNTKKHWKLTVGLGVGLGVPLIGTLSYMLVKRHRK